MAKEVDEHVIMQLEHDRKKFIPVRFAWLMDSEKVREQLKKSNKHQEPIFFFYHNVTTSKPSFSVSIYSQIFDPKTPACYKGYISNKIYGEWVQVKEIILILDAIILSQIHIPPPQLTLKRNESQWHRVKKHPKSQKLNWKWRQR